MRLTLRTLLAYVDDILDSSDQDEIRKKVESSEFATDLLHRTRDTMSRLRLGAPPVMGGDGALDPNTVAEYLDNGLPPEQVGDFERVCLESDIHLAEVGSCHQILTMVLGEPAEIDPDSRQRMYEVPLLAEQVSAADAGNEFGKVAATEQSAEHGQSEVNASLPRAVPIDETHHVPDYLRESFFQRHRGKLAIAAVLLIAAMVTFYIRTPDETPVPGEMGGDKGLVAATTEPAIEGEGEDLGGVQGTSPDMETGTGDLDAPLFEPGPLVEGATADEGNPEMRLPAEPGEVTGEPALPMALESGSDGGTPAPTTEVDVLSSPVLPEVDVLSSPVLPEGDVLASPAIPEGPNIGPAPAVGPAVMPAPGSEGGPGDASEPEAPADADASTSADTTPIPVEPAGPTQLATYLASSEVLFRHNRETNAWIRLAPRAKLYAGDPLLAIPAFRPTIALASGIQVQLDGGTRIVLGGFDDPTASQPAGNTIEAEPIGLELVYGRAILVSTMPGTAALSLRIGDQRAVIRFEGTATLAVEVLRELPAGADPLTSPAIVTADFYATSGHLQWSSQGIDPIDIAPSSTWKVSSEGVSEPKRIETFDGLMWIDGVTGSSVDRLAAPKMADALEPGQPVKLRLSELNEDRRRELRSLAGRVSVHIGYFEPFVASLNDSAQHAVWNEHIHTLKDALTLGPEVAIQVREAFRRQKGDEGDDLFEMVVGYSIDDLKEDKLAELVQLLDHDSLDCRALAFYNLQQLTGKRLGYRPQDPPQKRARAILVWNERLESNQLLP